MKKQKKMFHRIFYIIKILALAQLFYWKILINWITFWTKVTASLKNFTFFFSGKYAQIFILKMPGKYLPKIVFVI